MDTHTNAQTHKQLALCCFGLRPHPKLRRFVLWSHTNELIVGTMDNTAHIYKGDTGRLVATLCDRTGGGSNYEVSALPFAFARLYRSIT